VFVVSMIVFFWSPEEKAKPSLSQSTGGDGSHNINTRDGSVTINHYAPPPPPPTPQPESPWNDPKFSLQGPPRKLLPDMPLSAVLTRLHDLFGEVSDEDEGALDGLDLKIHEAIVDAAYNKRIDVWGRMQPGKPAKLVWSEAWERGQLSVPNNEVTYRSPDNPHGIFRWTGLMFNQEQVDRCWPPKPEYGMIVV
jgi:hypothetical protein